MHNYGPFQNKDQILHLGKNLENDTIIPYIQPLGK